MLRCLVTGGKGFIGSHLVNYLKSQGYYVINADIVRESFLETKEDLFYQVDLRNPTVCEVITQDVDWVFNLAANMGGIGYITKIGVDIDEKRIRQIRMNEYIPEPHVNEYISLYGKNLKVGTNYEILKECEIVFIIVQSPSLPSGKFNSSYVASALKKLHNVNPNCLAVISSTINVGDMEKFAKIHKRICYNPEMIAQGKIISDFEKPKYIIIGAYDKKEAEILSKFWRKVLAETAPNVPIIIMSPVEAEISKISLNFSFTLGITFANIIGEVCERFGANPNIVLDVIYRDRRSYKPGLGFGGFCFPRDVKNFKALCLELGVKSGYEIAKLIDRINDLTVGFGDVFVHPYLSYPLLIYVNSVDLELFAHYEGQW